MQQSDQPKPRLFGTNGVRGVYGKTLTDELLVRLARALATYYASGPIIVGRDGRNSSPALSKLIRATINTAGIDTFDAGLVTTPCLQFAAKQPDYKGGIMITASHNPPEYNGIKPTASDGVEISRSDELIVEDIYYGNKLAQPVRIGQDSSNNSAISTYLEAVVSLVDSDKIKSRSFTIVLDTGNGAQAAVAPQLVKRLGCKVVVINGQIDGDFPARGSEPLPTNLGMLCDTVKTSNAQLGVAFDGDGDRSIFCDETGTIVWGDKTGSLLVQHLLSTKHAHSEVICPINTSMTVEKVAEALGGHVGYTKVGSVEVSREMVNRKSTMGLEENGGFMYGPLNQVRDGAMTTALVLEMLSLSSGPFSKLVSALPRTYQYRDKFECTSKQMVEHVINVCISHGSPRKIEQMDGAKIWLDEESWLMVRPSGTEPLIRMYAESNDKALLESKVDEYKRLIRANLG